MTPKEICAAALLRQDSGHEKQALLSFGSKVLGGLRGAAQGGKQVAKGAPKVTPPPLPRTPPPVPRTTPPPVPGSNPLSLPAPRGGLPAPRGGAPTPIPRGGSPVPGSTPRLRPDLAPKGKPYFSPTAVGAGTNRMNLGMQLMGSSNRMGQWAGKQLFNWGDKTRQTFNAAAQAGQKTRGAWDAATGTQRAGMVGKGLGKGLLNFTGKAFVPATMFQTGKSVGGAAATPEAYAAGAGDALGYMQANPLQSIGLALISPEAAARRVSEMGLPPEVQAPLLDRMRSGYYAQKQGLDPTLYGVNSMAAAADSGVYNNARLGGGWNPINWGLDLTALRGLPGVRSIPGVGGGGGSAGRILEGEALKRMGAL